MQIMNFYYINHNVNVCNCDIVKYIDIQTQWNLIFAARNDQQLVKFIH